MDAGPGINFFSINKERLLFATIGAIAIPEAVETEIMRKARQDQRFVAAERVLKKVPPHLLEILSDDYTDELGGVVSRIAGMPLERRMHSSKDLGEMMVVAHAVVAAELGADILVLVDDQGGRRMIARESARLDRLRIANPSLGRIRLVSTITILRSAAGGDHLPDRTALRDLYARLRGLDDGLPPLESTGLLDLPTWS
ncbi:hypothetical protein SAMN06298212_1027 [Ruaniaceae bacterium KH17]|nr:hypothetical protein SAMN06298212_1027 [Ruaniaceae bacterium KH17]